MPPIKSCEPFLQVAQLLRFTNTDVGFERIAYLSSLYHCLLAACHIWSYVHYLTSNRNWFILHFFKSQIIFTII